MTIRGAVARVLLAVLAVGWVAALGPVPVASASQGSVPLVVSLYATAPDGLVARLTDLFGPGKGGPGEDGPAKSGTAEDGTGIAFDETTTVGTISRAFALGGETAVEGAESRSLRDSKGAALREPQRTAVSQTDVEPPELVNRWAVPVSVAGKVVGTAVIWINPDGNRADLADFVKGPALADALATIPADSYLVSDEPRGAWLVATPPTLTVLVSGTSGMSGETTLAEYRHAIAAATAPPESGIPLGTVLSIGTIVVAGLVVVLAVLIPRLRARRRAAELSAPADD